MKLQSTSRVLRQLTARAPIGALALASLAAAPSADFLNGDFEAGLTGWTVEYAKFQKVSGSCSPPSGWSTTKPGGHPAAAIHTASSPNQPGQVLKVLPFGGAQMARINDIKGSYHATRLSQAVALTPTDIAQGYVQVDWGAMLVNPAGHDHGCQPSFSIDVLKNGSSIESFSADGDQAAQAGSGWVHAGQASGAALYHTTGQFCTDISQCMVGDNIEVRMSVTDCGLGAHGGFAYLDNVGFGPCLGAECMDVTGGKVTCDPATGLVNYTFTITNNSGVDASWLLIPDPPGATALSQNVIQLDPPVSGAGGTRTISIDISNAPAGQLCLDMVLQDSTFANCCSTNVLTCIDIPNCDPCAVVLSINAQCTGVGNDFDYTFTFVNTSGFDMHKGFIIPPALSGITVHEDDFDLVALTGSPVEPGETATVTTTVIGAVPGQTICFTVVVHDATLSNCCSFEACTAVPFCISCPIKPINLGFAGPGDAHLFIAGNPLATGGDISVNVANAPANTIALTVFGVQNFPIPVMGGTLVPTDLLVIMQGITDAEGAAELGLNIAPLPPGLSFYAQTVTLDPEQTFGFGFSNAVEVPIF